MLPRFKTIATVLVLAGIGCAMTGAAGVAPPPAPAATPAPLSSRPADVLALAREAYVWGWPLVYLHNCRVALERVPAPGRSGGMPVAPLNRLAMLSDRIDPRATAVPCPNQDVIYGFGMFDLEADAVVLQVPDFGGRFWLYQLGDQRTDGFAEVGSLYGTRPGHYLVVGPDWKGTVPPGIAGLFRCPTRYGYCLPRVHFADGAADLKEVQPTLNQIAAYPLAEFTGDFQTTDWARPRWLPNLAVSRAKARGVSPEKFFETLPAVLDEVPPLPGEEPLYGRLRRLLAAAEKDPGLAADLRQAATEAERDLIGPLFEFRNVGLPLPGHWTTIVNGAAFGTDYLTRAAVARSNIFVNRHRETKYYFQDLDAHGRRLDGSREYRVTFPPGALPPARGFWSLTLYDGRHALPQQEGGRHAIGSRDPTVRYGADGSLTIVIGRAGQPDENRLTPPDGPFSLYLRLYWPEESALDGVWTPPPVRSTASSLLHAGA
jgi:hypothetical protein